MRKGSKKLDEMESLGVVTTRQMMKDDLQMGRINILEYDKTHAIPSYQFVEKIDKRILDIMSRLCDACHEMDNRIEPWASIKRDIEGLK